MQGSASWSKIEYLVTSSQIADLLTKSLSKSKCVNLRENLFDGTMSLYNFQLVDIFFY